MSKTNSLGGGLQTELGAVRLKMAKSVERVREREAVVLPPSKKRKVLAFAPKLPGVSKKTAPKERNRIVLKVNVRSPALQRRLGL